MRQLIKRAIGSVKVALCKLLDATKIFRDSKQCVRVKGKLTECFVM